MAQKGDVIEFPQAKGIVVSGDIHGDITPLVFKCCVQYGMTDTLIIVAGDCGFGFERPVFDKKRLDNIDSRCAIDTVITHTSPSFCELSAHHFLENWIEQDEELLDDIKYERQVMDDIYNYLYSKNHPLRYWYYGHFHESWHAKIEDVMFHMLDIMELREMPPI